MGLLHLKSDKAMKSYFGPDSFAGDPRVFLAEKPFITIQGEGPNIGKNTLFIRFFGCNLANSCGVDWCDSGHSFYTNEEIKEGYSEKPDRITYKNVEQMYEQVFELNNLSEFHNIVFTGGEPLLWQLTIAQLIRLLRDKYKRHITVEIETNGTVPIETDLVDWFRMVHFNISPKIHVVKAFTLLNQLQGLGHIGEKDYGYVHFDHSDWIVKFVVDSTENIIEKIEECITKHEISKDKVYLMPEGISRTEQTEKMQELAEFCINNGYNFSARLHVLIWDECRGI